MRRCAAGTNLKNPSSESHLAAKWTLSRKRRIEPRDQRQLALKLSSRPPRTGGGSIRHQHPGALEHNREDEDCGSGEDTKSRDRDRETECLGGSYARGDQGRSAGPDLCRGASGTDRERRSCCAGAKEDERE